MCLGDITTTTTTTAAAADSDTENLGDLLESRIVELFGEAADIPVTLSKDDGVARTEVRLKFDGGAAMTSMAESTIRGIPPSHFKDYLVDFRENFKNSNPAIRDLDIVETASAVPLSQRQREGVKLVLSLPFPLSNRVMLHYKYLTLHRNGDPDEHLLILSERNNQPLLEKYLSPAEERKYVLAKTYLAAYWIQPVKDDARDTSKITGTTVKYVFSGDMGGSIPKKIQEWTAPQNMLGSINGIVGYGKKKFENQ